MDERGYLTIKDRLRDVIITGGFNVYPVDVENALARHPAVYECSVFGVPDDKWGEAVQAAVQFHGGASAEPQELMLFVRSEEHTSELQSIMRNSYAYLCLKQQQYN